MPVTVLPEQIVDPYLDPALGILRNRVGASTRVELEAAEADLVAARTVQLLDHRLVKPTRDAEEIQGLHRHLFQDLFEWAGNFRVIDMRRGDGDYFAPCAMVAALVDNIAVNLFEIDNLRGLNRTDFVSMLAKFYDELNFAHPFREGNGRTQRLFWSRLAFDAGWIVNWQSVKGDELNEVSRLAREEGDLRPLETTLSKCVEQRL